MTSLTSSQPPAIPADDSDRKRWTFSLSSDPITPDEQSIFEHDLETLGVDRTIWAGLNAVVRTGTPASRPLIARTAVGNRLLGLALVYECTKTGESLFDPPLSRMMDMPGMPMGVWFRYGITTDQCANPGFVAPGVDRRELVAYTIEALRRKYMLAAVIEYAAAPASPGALQLPFADTGIVDRDGLESVEQFLGRGKNLSRKLSKFRNKGGEVQVIEGALPTHLQRAAIDALDNLDIKYGTPFQDNYAGMARTMMEIDSPEMVHFVALIDGKYVGHQSFRRSGRQLHCQSGWFERRLKTTYHAYENIIITSVEYLFRNDLQRIDYGPVLNETKKKLMPRFIPLENRIYARYRPVSATLPYLMRFSKVSPERVAPWVELGEEAVQAYE